jgi:hypothetical protein
MGHLPFGLTTVEGGPHMTSTSLIDYVRRNIRRKVLGKYSDAYSK